MPRSPKPKPKSANDSRPASARVRDYTMALPAEFRPRFRALRRALRAGAPDAVDGFSYGMPSLVLHGQPVIWYAAWKHHVGLYPISVDIARTHAAALEPYVHSKGTVRFPLDEPLPLPLVRELLAARLAELGSPAPKAATRKSQKPAGDRVTHPNERAFPPGISGPALRALHNAGIRSLAGAARWSRRDVAALHGMGPKALGVLDAALEAEGLVFRVK